MSDVVEVLAEYIRNETGFTGSLATEDDLLGVAMSGSYGLTASAMLFLGRDTPVELVLGQGQVSVGRRRHSLLEFN